jgi:hypothetical protein
MRVAAQEDATRTECTKPGHAVLRDVIPKPVARRTGLAGAPLARRIATARNAATTGAAANAVRAPAD